MSRTGVVLYEVPVRQPSIEEALEKVATHWLAIPGVVGVYAGERRDGTACLTVMISVSAAAMTGRIPTEAGGFPVVFEPASDLRPMTESDAG